MLDDLSGCYERLTADQIAPDQFAQELLSISTSSPDRAWHALALLDRAYRQRRISEDLCRTLRKRIGAQALRREGYRIEPEPPPLQQHPSPEALEIRAAIETFQSVLRGSPAPVQSMLPPPQAESPPAEPERPEPLRSRASQPGPLHAAVTVPPVAAGGRGRARLALHIASALLLIGAVLGVAASTRIRERTAPPPVPVRALAPKPTARVATVEQDPAIVSISSDRYIVRPHQRSVQITFRREPGTAGGARIRWWIVPAGARPGRDYAGARAGIVEVPAGSDSVQLHVPILPDPRRRHIETFDVLIGHIAGGAEPGSIRRATVFVFPDRDE